MFKWLFGKKDDSSDGAQAGANAEIVVLTRKVAIAPEAAFDAFVGRIDAWWPKDRRTAGGPLKIDARFGGRVTEGGETVGSVLSCHRPEHIVIAWQIGPGGRLEPSEGSASRIDVRFVAVDPAATEVVIVHRDFPRHGDGWQAYRAELAGKSGWPQIADAFARVAGAQP
jgi:uncharacterized protein YndB with AHSA1/START domain